MQAEALKAVTTMLRDDSGITEPLAEINKQVADRYSHFESMIDEDPIGSDSVPFGRGGRVYFLMLDGVVIYVGQTMHLTERITCHVNDGKVFDEVSSFEVDEHLLIVEAFNIRHHQPELNICRPSVPDLYKAVIKTINFI